MKLDPSKFCQLHCHTQYSQRDGAIPIRKLVDTAVDTHGQTAVGVSDHGTLSSAYDLYNYATAVRVKKAKPIIGVEFYVNPVRKELFEWLPKAQEVEDKKERAETRKKLAKYYHLLAIARTRKGYFNLVKVHNEAWQNGFYNRPMITMEMLLDNAEDIIASTACQNGIIPAMLGRGEFDQAEREVYRMKEAFKDWFFIELMPINHPTQKSFNEALIELAKKTKTPMIITNDSHYVEKDDHEIHRILINLDKLTKAGGEEKEKAATMWEFETTDLYLKSVQDMYDSWKNEHKSSIFTEAVFEECLENVGRIITAVQPYDLEGTPKLPKFTEDEWEMFCNLVAEGFEYRMKKGEIPMKDIQLYKERAEMEMKIIRSIRAIDYFLVYWDIMRFCREADIAVGPGRGSAAGSLVCWLLRITDIDPLRFGLFFERFINTDRIPKMKLEIG